LTSGKVGIALAASVMVAIALAVVISFRQEATQIPMTDTATSSAGNPGAQANSTSSSETFEECSDTTVTFANMTWEENPCAPPILPSAQLENATLDSPQVQAFIKDAYEYHRVYYRTGIGTEGQTDEILNVTGRQVVTGNWTNAYLMSYVGNHLLNVTVAPTTESMYDVTHISVYNLPDRNYSVTFTALQRQVINGALSNSTVKSLMVGGPYYVRYVSPLENNTITGPPKSSGNSTVAIPDSYFVQFNLVNGTANVSAYLDKNFTTVTSTFSDEPFSTECFGNGLIISDPWWSYSGKILQNATSCPP
jgi:hypothetical protein